MYTWGSPAGLCISYRGGISYNIYFRVSRLYNHDFNYKYCALFPEERACGRGDLPANFRDGIFFCLGTGVLQAPWIVSTTVNNKLE